MAGLKHGDRVMVEAPQGAMVEYVLLDKAPAFVESVHPRAHYGAPRIASRAETSQNGGTGQRWWVQVADTGELLGYSIRESRMVLLARWDQPELRLAA